MFARFFGQAISSSAARKLGMATAATLGAGYGIWGSSDDKNISSKQGTPGEAETYKSMIGENMSNVLQSHAPVNAFKTHLTNFRLYSNEPGRQIVTQEYMSHINEDVMQSLLFDSNKSGAKLLGVEYVITEKLYNQLPEQEKKLWHPRSWEAKSGALVAPGMPMALEHKLMSDLAPTFGKTFALWHVDSDPLPMGIPQLLIAPNKEGMINRELLAARDRRFGIDTEAERRNRTDIPEPRRMMPVDATTGINLRAEVIKNTTTWI